MGTVSGPRANRTSKEEEERSFVVASLVVVAMPHTTPSMFSWYGANEDPSVVTYKHLWFLVGSRKDDDDGGGWMDKRSVQHS